MKLSRRDAVRAYINLIKHRIDEPIYRTRAGQTALHHIIPKKLVKYKFIVESKNNIIRLYDHEHLLAHYYLAIIFPDVVEVQTAFYLMSRLKHFPKVEEISVVAERYEQSRKKFISSIKDKTYKDRYGSNRAQKIKIKQKLSKLNKFIRVIPVDK